MVSDSNPKFTNVCNNRKIFMDIDLINGFCFFFSGIWFLYRVITKKGLTREWDYTRIQSLGIGIIGIIVEIMLIFGITHI